MKCYPHPSFSPHLHILDLSNPRVRLGDLDHHIAYDGHVVMLFMPSVIRMNNLEVKGPHKLYIYIQSGRLVSLESGKLLNQTRLWVASSDVGEPAHLKCDLVQFKQGYCLA